MMHKPELVIFDCDGVLIDSEILSSRTLSEALRRANVDLSPMDVHLHFTGKSERDIRRICEDDYGLTDTDAVFSSWHETLYQAFAVDLMPMAGMADLVHSLQIKKSVASNSRNERLLLSLGRTVLWENLAPHVYGADSVKNPKPAPDLLLHCAAQHNAKPEASIMIDDSPHGISAAVAAGMMPVGFIDLNDPRPNRDTILRNAGAEHIAKGAGELAVILNTLGCVFDETRYQHG
ncbi:HAD-IA family hydrolase [Paenochrobactrum glaciei]|uniref:HAD family hydrolase n=1 Tax=Paenochrobactrum glaciei TaxID=486407 RepID=A0ABN1G9R8_9HYPH